MSGSRPLNGMRSFWPPHNVHCHGCSQSYRHNHAHGLIEQMMDSSNNEHCITKLGNMHEHLISQLSRSQASAHL